MNKQSTLIAIRAFVVLTLLTGIIYPLTITVIAQVLFPQQANGSLIEVNGTIIGSDLIGQQTDDPRYFWWRPSAVNAMQGSSLENPASSGATNYGSSNAALETQIMERQEAFDSANHLADNIAIPQEMLFASASGLDPHISPLAARLQIDRIAEVRGLPVEKVADLVESMIEAPQLRFLGESRVNVLRLNLALDALE